MSFDSSDSDVDSDVEVEDLQDLEDDEPIGPRLEDFYEVGKEIGRGAFSIVKEGVNKATGKKVAIKSIRTRYIKNKLLIREIDIMKKVGNHPNILKLHEVFETKNFLYLVLELVTGGELFDQIVARGEYSEKDASNIVRQIISAVAHLHANGIAHRDLKPQNLLCAGVDGDDIRMADFGLSKMFDQGEYLVTCCGSPEYVAPEVLECKPYDKACDLWSVGVITYVLLTGCFPFWDKNNAVLYEKIRKVEYGWPSGSEISPEAKDLIRHLIEKNPEKRYTAEQALQHPWVTGQGVSNAKRITSTVPSRKK
jgi:calcium/calmodulin-dependent protein kinase I